MSMPAREAEHLEPARCMARNSQAATPAALIGLLGALNFAGAAPAAAQKLPPSAPRYGVRIENAFIRMHDGVRLAVTLYMPDRGKPGERFPPCSNICRIARTTTISCGTTAITAISRAGDTWARASTSADSATAKARRPTASIPLRSRKTARGHRLAGGANRGRTATSACSASPGAASIRFRWRCAGRRRSSHRRSRRHRGAVQGRRALHGRHIPRR